MIGWILITVFLLAFGIWLLWKDNEVGFFPILLSIVVLIYALGVSMVDYPKFINQFTQQQTYLESHVPENDIEDAALTQKKIELNSWLYDAKFSVERYGIFSLYPKSVLELEPID